MEPFAKGASYSPFEQKRNFLEIEFKEFCTRLTDFPNSFHLEDQEILRPTTIERLRKGLECALKAGYSTSLERARARNLLAFTLFRQGKSTQALQELELALQEDGERQNIVSMANKAVILWKIGKRYAATIQAEFLDDLKRENKEFEYLAIKAKAELAFSYTRLGNKYFPIAVRLFQKIIPMAREPEKWLWTFGLALTLRRQTHFQLAPYVGASASSTGRSLFILRLFKEVINNSQSLQAKAYAEIGVLLKNNSYNHTVLDEAGMDAVEACNKALKLDNDDNSVLCKSSKIFRYFKVDLDICCELLEKAFSKRPSSTVYHHFGLTYKAMATDLKYPSRDETQHNGNQNRRGRPGYRGRNGYRRRGELSNSQSRNWRCNIPEEHYQQIGNGFEKEFEKIRHSEIGSKCQETKGNIPSKVFGNKRGRRGERRGRYKTNSEFTRYAGVSMAGGDRQIELKTNQNEKSRGTERGGRGIWAMTHANYYSKFREDEHHGTALLHLSNVNRSTQKTYESDLLSNSASTFPESAFGTPESPPLVSKCSRSPVNHYVQMLRKMVKSPMKTTTFVRHNKYVSETIENFQNAIIFSERENKRAMYDLALMYKALGEYHEALALLEEMRASEDTLPIDRVNAFEQSGLIFLDMIKDETNSREKILLQKEGDAMLNCALSLASRYFSNIPQFQDHIGEIWHSFSTLDKGLGHRDLTKGCILMEKTRLLQVIKKAKESKKFLQTLEKISPAAAQNPEYIKMRLECYIAENDFHCAATLISLQSEQIRKEVKKMFKDEQYLLKMYYEASRQVLFKTSEKVSLAQEYFRFAFEETFENSLVPVSSSEDTDDSDSSYRDVQMNHVMFIHDYKTKSEMTNARKLACLIRHVCGLRTSWSCEDCTPGLETNAALRQIKKSHLVVVIAGSDKLSSEFRMCITKAVQSRPTVTLLLDGTHVPKAMRGRPVMECPQVILDMDFDDDGMQTPDRVDAICNVFRFLVGIKTNDTEM